MAKQERSGILGLGDSYLNLIIGIIVVVAIAAVVIGLIRGRATQQTEQASQQTAEELKELGDLPAKHTVAPGEDLWKISEKYYQTGYNWVDIARENNIANPDAIAEGVELTIPDVAPRAGGEAPSQPSPVPTVPPQQDMTNAITGNSYTVVAGDHLWSIAVRAYGDGYRWVDIARANKLVNPDIIHRGNILTLPR